MEFLKTVGAKVVAGIVALAVIAGAISWFEMDPATRHRIVTGTGRIAAWTGIVLVLPWATFFIITRVASLDSNLAGGVLVFGYTAIEAVLLAWFFSWTLRGPTEISLFSAATVLAAGYNLLTCDWIAEKLE